MGGVNCVCNFVCWVFSVQAETPASNNSRERKKRETVATNSSNMKTNPASQNQNTFHKLIQDVIKSSDLIEAPQAHHRHCYNSHNKSYIHAI